MGIELAWSLNNTISNNYLLQIGIKVVESKNNVIQRNTFQTYGDAIDVENNANYNMFISNNITKACYVSTYITQSVTRL